MENIGMELVNGMDAIKEREALGTKRRYIYMVTIHKHQVLDHVTHTELLDVYLSLMTRLPGNFSNIVFEISPKYNQLHMHFIVKSPYRIHYSNYSKIQDYRVYWRLVHSLKGVVEYLKKDAYNKYIQEQILAENHYYTKYRFI